jgi:TonB family protein
MTTASDFTQPNQRPNTKLLAATIAGVVALHIGVGIGLMKMPSFTLEAPKVTPPLEISFVQLPKPVDPNPIKLDASPEPVLVEKSPSKAVPEVPSKPEPKPTPKPITEKVNNIEPKPKPVPKPEATKPVVKTIKPPVESPKPAKLEPKPDAPVKPQIDQQAIVAAQVQREQAERQSAEQQRKAQEQAERQKAEKQRLAEQQAERQRAAQAQLAKAQADQARAEREQAERQSAEQQRLAQQKAERQKAEQERRERERQQAAKDSEPVSFGNGDAAWRSKPNLNFSGNLARIIESEHLTSIGVRLNVSSSGSVTSVAITRSSGNGLVDNAVRQRLLSAKLKPFTRNGMAVPGVGNLTVNLN